MGSATCRNVFWANTFTGRIACALPVRTSTAWLTPRRRERERARDPSMRGSPPTRVSPRHLRRRWPSSNGARTGATRRKETTLDSARERRAGSRRFDKCARCECIGEPDQKGEIRIGIPLEKTWQRRKTQTKGWYHMFSFVHPWYSSFALPSHFLQRIVVTVVLKACFALCQCNKR